MSSLIRSTMQTTTKKFRSDFSAESTVLEMNEHRKSNQLEAKDEVSPDTPGLAPIRR